MDIFEDDLFFPSDSKGKNDIKEDKKENENEIKVPLNPGTRIIYTAPIQSGKRKFVGFSDLDDEEEISLSKPEETPPQKPKRLENREVVFEEDEISIDTPKYSGGFAFEEKMRQQNKLPVKKQGSHQGKKRLSVEEEKQKRYAEAQRLRKEQIIKQYSSMEKKKAEKDYRPYDEDEEIDKIEEIEEIKIKEYEFDFRGFDQELEEIELEDDKEFYRKAYKEDRKIKRKEIIRKVVLVVAIVVMLGSLGVIAKKVIEAQKGKTDINKINELLIDVTEESTTKKSKKKKDKSSKEEEEKETTETTTKPLTEEEQWEQLKKDYPNIDFPEGLSLRYAKLYATNQDFVGYLSIPELGVGLPVVQSQKDTNKDNYYLRKNFYKEYSVYGTPFVHKNNDMKKLDRNTVIYGHNNNSNLAFAPINNYKTLEGYKKAPVIEFDTLYGKYKWQIFAAFITNTKAEDDNDYVFNYTFLDMEDDTNFVLYIEELKARSIYQTGVEVLANDKILTLSTCSHEFDDARFVVVARLVKDGESSEVNTSKAILTSSPRYPQAYYDAKKKKNPYIDADKWYYPE